MSRACLALVLAGVVVSGGGCATLGGGREVQVPGSDRLYVAVFVDETEAGEVGVALAEAIQIELYQRDPLTLATQFEDGSVAVDGTVERVEEVELPSGKRELRVRIRCLLVDKSGAVVADLGAAESRAAFSTRGGAAAVTAARQDALRRAIETLARHVISEIDARGRGERAAHAGRGRPSTTTARAAQISPSSSPPTCPPPTT